MTEYPRIFIPEGDLQVLRFVQVSVGRNSAHPFMRFENINENHYGNILEHMLQGLGLKYEYLPESEDLPELVGDNYHTVGMGICAKKDKEILISKNVKSWDYEIGFNHEHFDRTLLCATQENKLPKGIEFITI